MENVGKRLKAFRKQKGLTLRKLAKLAGISHSFIADIEAGRGNPSLETLTVLAGALGISVAELVSNTGASLFRNQHTPEQLLREAGAFPVEVNQVPIPIYGVVQAGYPMLAQEEIIGYQYEPAENVRGGEYFYLRVKGDSMIGAGIHPGDIVLVRRQDILDNGQIGVVMVGSEEATLKRVYRRDNQYVLVAENPAYEPQVYPAKEVRIVGEAIKVERWLNGRK